MLKFARVENEETKAVSIATGSNPPEGYTEIEVEQDWLGRWYVAGYAPEKPTPTEEEQRKKRAEAYRLEKDPITCQITSLRDEEQTPEIVEEINELLQKRTEVVKDIQERYPYPVTDETTNQEENDQT